ncbi:hypothetical protein JCM11641_008127 [Rhodosporidiobolus odoratus]
MLAKSTLTLTLVSLAASTVSATHAPVEPLHRLKRAETVATASASHPSATVTQNAAESTVTSAPVVASTKVAQLAAASALPLTEYTYAYSDVPYQVNPYQSTRGPQVGYNQCNETTKGDGSMCQTLIANNASDFCLWGSSLTEGQDTIGDIEAATVAYCTSDTHGARLLKAGAITGLQVLHAQYYTQWTGYLDQTALHLTADDSGGELDPHGADLLGNPLGGLVYSTGLPEGDNKTYTQAVEWNNFIGGGFFCLKLCSPNQPSGINYCENTYDRMGCNYNMPTETKDGEFSECDSDLQDRVGVYTASNGAVSTYTQPPEGTAPAPPYTPKIPKTSNCRTYASTELFAGPTSSSASSSASATGSANSASSAGASQSGSSNSNSSSSGDSGSGATMLVASTGVVALLVGVLAVLA